MKRTLRILGLAAAVAATAWTGLWLYVARDVAARIGVWQREQADAGVALGWDELAVKGWPFGWRVVLEKPHAMGAGPTHWRWSGDRLVANIDPRDLHQIAFRLPGQQQVRLGSGDLEIAVALRAARPEGRLRFDDVGRVATLSLDIEAAELQVGHQPPWATRQLTVEISPHRPQAPTQASNMLDFSVRVDALRLPAPVDVLASLGRDIKLGEIAGRLEGPVRGATLAQALAAWRDAGGTLEIASARLEWGALRLTGDATLALDAQNRPLGAGVARIAGASETLDALAQSGAIDARNAALLKIALTFLARNDPANGGAASVQIPIAAQDGVLSVHRFALLRLAPLGVE
jgi:hypothetical protein